LENNSSSAASKQQQQEMRSMKAPDRTEALTFSHASHAACATVPAIAERGNHIRRHMITIIIVMFDPLAYRDVVE
jgi:hypothetical protein